MRVNLKGIYASKKRRADGSIETYYYLRGFGALKPCDGDAGCEFHPGTQSFMRSYYAAVEVPKKVRVTGTLQQIIDAYLNSPELKALAPRTQSDYREHIKKIEGAVISKGMPTLGSYPLDAMEDPKIRPKLLAWRDKLSETSLRQADTRLAILSRVLEWGRNRGMIANNHASRPKKLYKADRADKLWLPEHLTAFREAATDEMRLALGLALWTGQRETDVLKLTWSNIKDGRLKFRQGKKRRLVDMPIPSGLKSLLDAAPRKAMTILTDPKGKPWTTDPRPIYFMHCWRKAILAAGLNGLHFHDLRGTTCTMLADAGCTPSEIASVLGWTVKSVMEMLDRYQSMTASQSDSAIAKLNAKGGY